MDRIQATAAAPAAAAVPSCCGRAMSAVSVTEEGTELRLLSCSSCSRHAWLQDGVLLDRAGMLEAVRRRLEHAPKPRPGRPKGSRTQRPARSGGPVVPAVAPPSPGPARPDLPDLLRGFRVLGADGTGMSALPDRSD